MFEIEGVKTSFVGKGYKASKISVLVQKKVYLIIHETGICEVKTLAMIME